MSTHKIDDLLSEGHHRFTALQRLLKKSSDQKAWTAQLRVLLDAPLKYDVEVTDVQGPTLYLLCKNAAAATRIRFLMPEVIPKLNNLASFQAVRQSTIRVAI